MYKDKQREAIALCRHCGHRLELMPGKVPKRFCNDTCRKAYKRAELAKSKATAGPSVDELRTVDTKQPRTPTPDIPNKLTVQTLEKSERGEELTEFDNTEALLEDLHDTKPKRGKDIKCFADLSPDVQQTIDMMAMIDGKIDKTIKANRTAIAINYQHLFPGRYHSTGVV